MKKGFASMVMVYSFFLVFVLIMLTTLLIHNYKSHFLNVLKNDVKEELELNKIKINDINIDNNNENSGFDV